MSLFSELKKRNVFRVGAAYAVFAWLVIQIVETVFPAFGFGDSAVRLVVIIFAIGLVPVLVFSWLFEFTPEGFRREGTVDHARPVAVAMVKRLDRAIIIVLTLAVGFFALDKFLLQPARDVELERETSERVRSETLAESYGDSSIAVMPFVNMSDDKANEYFSDGMSEELLNLLAKIPRLRVISQSSSFSLKGKGLTIPEVAKQLNVGFVLEGSVRKYGQQVRITAQLIEARSDTHLWSETYDRQLDDLFAIQDEISAAIVAELKNRLKLDLVEAPTTQGDVNLEAYDALLRGRFLFNQRTDESKVAAIAEFERAVALDPDYAPAHAELALAMMFVAPDDGDLQGKIASATRHAEKALELDPGLAEAYAAKAWLLMEFTDMGGNEAQRMFRRALELNPNYAIVYTWMANSGMASSPEEAFAYEEKALHLDPLSIPSNIAFIRSLIARGRLAEADQQLEKYAAISPRGAVALRGRRTSLDGSWADFVLAFLEAEKGEAGELNYRQAYFDDMLWHLDSLGLEGEAIRLGREFDSNGYVHFDTLEEEVKAAEESLQYSPGSYGTQIGLGVAYARAGRYEDARPYLEKQWKGLSQGEGEGSMAWQWSPVFADLAEAWFTVLQHSGEEAAARQVLDFYQAEFKRFRDAGIVQTEWDYSIDFQEGRGLYLAGEREAGLALMAKAADQGYWIGPPSGFFPSMYQDPGFVSILEKQRTRQARERDKLLKVVCNNNPYAEIWQPLPETCKEIQPAATQ